MDSFNNRYTELINEFVKPIVLYSGQRSPEPTFSAVGIGQGFDQEGVGFYFTTNREESFKYSGEGGIVITATVNDVTGWIHEDVQLSETELAKAEKLMKESPVFNDVLMDFGFDPPYVSQIQAYREMHDAMIDEADARDTFQQIGYDFYHRGGNDGMFIEKMAEMGINGLVVNRADNTQHYVVYNPNALTIVKVDKYEDLEEF